MDYRACNECYENRCVCERFETSYESRLKDSADEDISVDYELNY